jgi:site-specific DNA-cytosine methylase
MAAKQQMMPEKRRMAAVVAFQPGNIRRKAGAEPSTESFPTLGADTQGDQSPHVAFNWQSGSGMPVETDVSPTQIVNQTMAVQYHTTVRRLTPRECERLQGFPDDFTAWGIDESGKRVELSDSARYRMLGNAVTVNVAEWIGKRIVAELTEGRT